MRLRWLALAAAFTGCLTPVQYRLPLAGNSLRRETEQCYVACRARTGDAFLACLETCPAVVVTPGARCDARDRPPAALCEEASRVDGSRTTVALLATTVTAVLVVALVALGSADWGWEEH